MKSILTVITGADSVDLTTLDTVKLELGITNTTSDTKLAGWITQASELIAAECRRVFASETVEESFRLKSPDWYFPEPQSRIRLNRYPVSDVASVIEDGVTLTDDEFELDAEKGFLTRLVDDTPWEWTAAKVVVRYTGGYVLLDGLPRPLEQACISLVRGRHFSSARDPLAKEVEVYGIERVAYWVGSVSRDGSTALPPEVNSMIKPFRNALVA